MLKLENTEVLGCEHAIRGMRNPMNSWEKSDSGFCDVIGDNFGDIIKPESYRLGPNDHDLMMRLAKGGPVHAKYRRMIAVYVDITAPLYWWKEFDTYKVGTVANSCSTMHKIAAKEFTLEDFSCEHLFGNEDMLKWDERTDIAKDHALAAVNVDGDWCYFSPKGYIQMTCNMLNRFRQLYLETKDKKYWWQMIQLLPSSYNQRRTVMLNYEALANIYKSRRNHKLDEWHAFCDWIVDLPYSEIIIGKSEEKKDLMDIPICHEIMKEAKRRVYEELKEKGMKIFEDFWSGADSENKTEWPVPDNGIGRAVAEDLKKELGIVSPSEIYGDSDKNILTLNPEAGITDEEAKKRARMTGNLGTGEPQC